MNRHPVTLRVTVKDGERALLTRNGRFERVLGPGRHRLFDPARELSVEIFAVVRAEFSGRSLRRAQGGAAGARRRAVRGGRDGGERARHRQPRRPADASARPVADRACSGRSRPRVDVERIDVASDPKVAPRHLTMVDARRATRIVAETVVENHEAGLLYVEGRLVERLAPGRHAYWTVDRKVEVKRLDLRPQAVEITAQEMLTKDRIALRVTLTAFRRIVDPERAVGTVADVDALALPAGAVRDPRGGGRAHARRGAVGQERARRGAARLRARAPRGDGHRGDRARREGRDPARRDPRAREQGGGGGADGEGQPDPPPGGDRGDAFAPQHRQADGGQPAPPAAQGARSRSSGWSRRSAGSTSTPARARASMRCSTSSCASSPRKRHEKKVRPWATLHFRDEAERNAC